MADKNSNPGSKQADGNDDGNVFKSSPPDKESSGAAGGRTASGAAGAGKDGSTSKTGSESGGMSAGGKIRSEAANDEEKLSGESGSGKS